jgi:hypothetical protein
MKGLASDSKNTAGPRYSSGYDSLFSMFWLDHSFSFPGINISPADNASSHSPGWWYGRGSAAGPPSSPTPRPTTGPAAPRPPWRRCCRSVQVPAEHERDTRPAPTVSTSTRGTRAASFYIHPILPLSLSTLSPSLSGEKGKQRRTHLVRAPRRHARHQHDAAMALLLAHDARRSDVAESASMV